MHLKHKVAIFGIITALIATLGAAAFPLIPDFYEKNNDFIISVDPSLVKIEKNNMGSNIGSTTIKVNFGLLYDQNVTLKTDPKLPINVSFKPQILRRGTKSISTVTIFVDDKTPPGNYLISITGRGSDNKKHTCEFDLEVNLPLSEVTIDYDLKTAPIEVFMNGTAKNIQDGDKIWIVIYPHTAKKYYPQSEAQIQDEKWELLRPIRLGDVKDINTSFDVIAVLANQNAQDAFTAYVENQSSISENDGPWMWKLPNGAVEYDRITVTRE